MVPSSGRCDDARREDHAARARDRAVVERACVHGRNRLGVDLVAQQAARRARVALRALDALRAGGAGVALVTLVALRAGRARVALARDHLPVGGRPRRVADVAARLRDPRRATGRDDVIQRVRRAGSVGALPGTDHTGLSLEALVSLVALRALDALCTPVRDQLPVGGRPRRMREVAVRLRDVRGAVQRDDIVLRVRRSRCVPALPDADQPGRALVALQALQALGPVRPVGPAAPMGPAGPAGPVSPFAPEAPLSPCGPAGPSRPFQADTRAGAQVDDADRAVLDVLSGQHFLAAGPAAAVPATTAKTTANAATNFAFIAPSP